MSCAGLGVFSGAYTSVRVRERSGYCSASRRALMPPGDEPPDNTRVVLVLMYARPIIRWVEFQTVDHTTVERLIFWVEVVVRFAGTLRSQ